ncbi:MAG TPA: hypothetical protein DCR04_04540 [Flavobacteriales bacterium]|nr:hypothetical protein [Flavobacteriales bacterium]
MKKNLLYTFLTAVAVTISIFPSMGQSSGLAFPVITEIMYNPPEINADSLEFIEIYNPNMTDPLDVSGYYFSSGVDYTFPAGSVIPANGFAIVSVDSVAFENTFGIPAFEWPLGALSNSGEGIALRNSDDFVVDTVFYDDSNSWADADGTGFSLVLCDPNSDNNLPESWTLSENATGLTVNATAIFADPGQAATCITVGIADDNVITTAVYPNPAKDVFSMKFEPTQEVGALNIFNNLGQVVYTETLSLGTTSTTIDSQLPSGLYIVSLNVGDKREQLRLIVQ